MPHIKHVPLNFLIALDQLANTLAGGWPDETLSSRAARLQNKSKAWAMTRKASTASSSAQVWGQPSCRPGCWTWNWKGRSPACPADASSAWRAADQATRRSGLASIFCSASRVARMVTESSSRTASKPVCRYEAMRRSCSR